MVSTCLTLMSHTVIPRVKVQSLLSNNVFVVPCIYNWSLGVRFIQIINPMLYLFILLWIFNICLILCITVVFLKCKNKTLFYLKEKKQHLHEVNIVYFKLYHAHIFKVIVICLYSQKLCFCILWDTKRL